MFRSTRRCCAPCPRETPPRGRAFRVGTARRRAHSPVDDGAWTPLMAHPTGLFDIVRREFAFWQNEAKRLRALPAHREGNALDHGAWLKDVLVFLAAAG